MLAFYCHIANYQKLSLKQHPFITLHFLRVQGRHGCVFSSGSYQAEMFTGLCSFPEPLSSFFKLLANSGLCSYDTAVPIFLLVVPKGHLHSLLAKCLYWSIFKVSSGKPLSPPIPLTFCISLTRENAHSLRETHLISETYPGSSVLRSTALGPELHLPNPFAAVPRLVSDRMGEEAVCRWEARNLGDYVRILPTMNTFSRQLWLRSKQGETAK